MRPSPRRTGLASPAGEQGEADRGLLLIGHGTRDEQGRAEFFELASRVRQRLPQVICEACSLEFAEPSIGEGLARLARRGVTRATAIPLFLLAAGHVKQDIPAELARSASGIGGIEVNLAGHLGCDPALVELSVVRFEEATGASFSADSQNPWADTLLLMVGRGSHDPQANAEMVHFAQLRHQRTPLDGVEVCYAAMAEPSLEQGLKRAAASRFSRIVVQPHLLFRGELSRRVQHAVETWRGAGGKRWFVTEHLGPHDLAVEAVVKSAGF